MNPLGDKVDIGDSKKLLPCPGCGRAFPESQGPTHVYIGASPGCWEAYGRILAREFGEFHYPGVHRLTVDTYAVQHPGTPSRNSIQSVWGHLIALYLALEKRIAYREITRKLGAFVSRAPELEWLEPPADPGEISVLEVEGAKDLDDHTLRVERWAASVWNAWAQYHVRVAKMSQVLS